MAAKVYAKYPLEPEGRDVHGRFAALYNGASKGKQFLTYQCIAGGMLLRECGLLELTISICESEAYITAATPSQRRALLLGELGALSAAIKEAPVAPHSAIREPSAPTATPETSGEQTEASEEVVVPGEPPAAKRPAMRQPGMPLPELGASSSKK